jgi:hypothetical protein
MSWTLILRYLLLPKVVQAGKIKTAPEWTSPPYCPVSSLLWAVGRLRRHVSRLTWAWVGVVLEL